MNKVIKKKNVLFGNENYEYVITDKGEELLKKVEIINNQKVNIILKDVSEENSKDIKDYIIDVLSDLYIQRELKKLI